MKESHLFKKAITNEIINKDKIKNNILSTTTSSGKVSFFARKGAMAFVIAIVILFGAFIPMLGVYNYSINLNASPKTAESHDQLFEVIDNFNNKQSEKHFNFNDFVSGLSDLFEGTAFYHTSSDSGIAPEQIVDYSKTNIQTEGLDEGDIVKTDGQYIYKLNDKGFFIVGANNGQLEIITSIVIQNYIPKEMYIWGNKLVLIGGINETYSSSYIPVQPLFNYFDYANYNKTDIRIYDITQKDSPVLNRQITVDGKLNTSRLRLEDGKLLYTVNHRIISNVESTYVPKIKDTAINNGVQTYVPSEYIYFYDDVVNYYYLIVGEIDLQNPDANKLGVFLGLGGTIYVSQESIFVATYDYHSIYKKNFVGWVSDDGVVGSSRIIKISLDTLTQTASGRVNGKILDRYWMDEFEGNLRVATSASVRRGERYNNVFVLNSNLSVIGKIENIAPGENIYSVRFNGVTGSLVTFRQVDPYFNLDLSDPSNPLISDGLKEDGVSHYIHYIGDTAYTIGVGLMSEVVDSTWGGEIVIWTGLKVSLYDNSSGEAVNLNTIVLEGACYVELFYNPKALLYDEDTGLFAFAYENWQYDSYYDYESMQQGLAVFGFDLTQEDAQKLIYRGTLTNLESELNPYSSVSGYYNNYWAFVNRGIRIGDYIYTTSHQYIKSYSLSTLEEIELLDLYEVAE